MIKGKYLKYSPEITLEIFTLVCNKLIENGINLRKYSIEWHWDRFHVGYPNLLIPDGEEEFSVWGNTQNKRETTVQEILGYDPWATTVEKDWSKATKEELLAEANKRYPVGTKYGNNNNVLGVLKPYYNSQLKSYYITDGYGGCVYENNKWAEIIPLPETKVESKEIIPEYVECIKKDAFIIEGVIYKVQSEKGYSYNNDDVYFINNRPYFQIHFKPSTKEAFNAQNKPIEKWSVGSYVVFLRDLNNTKKGSVDLIKTGLELDNTIYLEKYLTLDISREQIGEIKWFATKSEAEEFAKTLVEPVKEEVKQPLKQAVHCKTQEEWDFVCDKRNSESLKGSYTKYKSESVIRFDFKNAYGDVEWCGKDGYQILSFQEWCDLNGYKMKNEVKFEVGKWYKYNPDVCLKFERIVTEKFRCSERIVDGIYSKVNSLYNTQNITPISIEEIQQYLPDNHIDKIKSNQEFKVGDYIFVMIKGKNFGDILKVTDFFIEKKSHYSGVWINHKPGSFGGGGFRLNGNGYIYGKDVRHATPEEINNHLISIGQIPAGEPLNTGIDPSKNGIFKYTSVGYNSFSGKFSTSMTRTVEINKPTIEFNYLPEPE